MIWVNTNKSTRTRGLFSYVFQFFSIVDRFPNDEIYINLRGATSYYDRRKGKNVWEYYFEQPFGLTYEQVRSRPDVQTGHFMQHFVRWGKINNTKDFPKEQIATMRRYCDKYIHIKDHILDIVGEFHGKYMQGKKVLGIQKRGTDHYRIGHGRKHPEMRKADFFLDQVNKHVSSYDLVYLITDERDTVKRFKQEYGNQLIHYDDAILSQSDGPDLHSFGKFDEHAYKRGEDVVVEMLLLSRVDFLLCVSSNVSSMSIGMNSALEYQYIDRHVRYVG
jgi:hypothetical protein